jgi:hypothetical protein
LIFVFTASLQTRSQGCNDAGICTFGDFQFEVPEQHSISQTEVSYIFGLGEQQVLINTLQLDQSFRILSDKAGIFVRLPFTYVYGNLGQTIGIGDVTVGLEMVLLDKKETRITMSAGSKLPPNDANFTVDGKGLPMAYQTSLGTYDLLVGSRLDIQKWRIGLGYQKPFGSNKNTFAHAEWEDNEQAQEYFESYHLDRGDDLLLRVDRYFETKKGEIIQAGLMSVYRLREDIIILDGEKQSLDQSSGLTLNAILATRFPLKNNGSLNILAAAPIITREYRADGLTRTFVLSVVYSLAY